MFTCTDLGAVTLSSGLFRNPTKLFMPVFPKITWQFQISVLPDKSFILPYHEYLDKIDSCQVKEEIQYEKLLDRIAIRIDDNTIIPNFKYVSMHLSNDKAIFLLYELKKSINEIKKHGIIPIENIEEIEKKNRIWFYSIIWFIIFSNQGKR